MAVTIVITGTKTVDFQKTQINKKNYCNGYRCDYYLC